MSSETSPARLERLNMDKNCESPPSALNLLSFVALKPGLEKGDCWPEISFIMITPTSWLCHYKTAQSKFLRIIYFMQYASSILMVRPARFGFNSQTAVSNTFQNKPGNLSPQAILAQARGEFDRFVMGLKAQKIEVVVVEDTDIPEKPDAVFPNNWVSFHPDGRVILYPMAVENRRLERRPDIIDMLKNQFDIRQVIDLSPEEGPGKILEGTGSIVFDHVNRIAYACLSPRTNRELLESVCQLLGYRPVVFHATDAQGVAIYHTNVMMSIGKGFAVVCQESITDGLKLSGLEIIDVSLSQMNQFACNVLQVANQDGQPFLVMSQTAESAFTPEQKRRLSQYAELLPVAIPTIETIGGGSARCMMAEIFCKRTHEVFELADGNRM